MTGLCHQLSCLFLPEIDRNDANRFSSTQQLSLDLYFFPDSSRVDKGDADLHGDPARAEPAAEEDGGPKLVGERRRDAAAEVPRGALRSHTGWEFGAEAPHMSSASRNRKRGEELRSS